MNKAKVVLFALGIGMIFGVVITRAAQQFPPVGLQVTTERTWHQAGSPTLSYKLKGVLASQDAYRDVTIVFPADRLSISAAEARIDPATKDIILQGIVRVAMDWSSSK